MVIFVSVYTKPFAPGHLKDAKNEDKAQYARIYIHAMKLFSCKYIDKNHISKHPDNFFMIRSANNIRVA